MTVTGSQGRRWGRKRSSTELVCNARATGDPWLPFEKRSVELETRLRTAATEEEREALQQELDAELQRAFSALTPWQRVQVARHPLRPRMLDYTSRVLDDFIELHGDRAVGDDPALIGGLGRFEGRTVVVVGNQKGVSTDERLRRNFGMAHPEGYRKALRLFHLAERFGYPVITFVDTPAAHPGIEAEQRGQGPAIAENLRAMPVSYTHLRAHETVLDLVCRLLLVKKKTHLDNTSIVTTTDEDVM